MFSGNPTTASCDFKRNICNLCLGFLAEKILPGLTSRGRGGEERTGAPTARSPEPCPAAAPARPHSSRRARSVPVRTGVTAGLAERPPLTPLVPPLRGERVFRRSRLFSSTLNRGELRAHPPKPRSGSTGRPLGLCRHPTPAPRRPACGPSPPPRGRWRARPSLGRPPAASPPLGPGAGPQHLPRAALLRQPTTAAKSGSSSPEAEVPPLPFRERR